jgi:ABC-type Zn uptake system ZnuABC Zn-binding protein ZnuA
MATRTVRALKQALLLSLGLALIATDAPAREKKLDILCTTFPIYQITRNVTQGRDAVKVGLMLPSQLGCPHDYVLTPGDVQKIAKARVLVINGLGMEEFVGAPVRQANPGILVVDSSAGIRQTLRYTGEEKHGHDRAHGGGKGRHHGGVNPHLFASPRMQLCSHRTSPRASPGLTRPGLPPTERTRSPTAIR